VTGITDTASSRAENGAGISLAASRDSVFKIDSFEEAVMQRISLLHVTVVVVISALLAPGTRADAQPDDKQAVENTVRAFEQAVQEYDFDKADSFLAPDARWIEDGYPAPVEPNTRRGFQRLKDMKISIDYHPQDAEVHVNGDVAWVTITLRSTFTAGSDAARALFGGQGERHPVLVESEILVRTPSGWKIVLGHSSRVPAPLGVSADLTQLRGMKFASVEPGSAADKAGFKAGDVMVEFGGQKIDTTGDFFRIMRGPSAGDKVTVTVMRGEERISKDVTLDAPK
jgi:ketosteroid isomerase-like protein